MSRVKKQGKWGGNRLELDREGQTKEFELFPVGNGDFLVWGEVEGEKGSTRGSNRNESLLGNITGRRIENDPLGPTLSNKIVLTG